MQNKITKEKLEKYFRITKEALDTARNAEFSDKKARDEIIKMAENYVSDAEHFFKQGNLVDAFSAVSYAHGWLDCGARLEIFKVKDSRLFVVDEEN